jgi:hypothetical protein
VSFGGFTETTTPPDTFCNYCIHVRGANDVRDTSEIQRLQASVGNQPQPRILTSRQRR